METLIIKPAETVQVEEIQNLLKNSGLPFEDINKHLKDFLCLMNNEEIIAVGGLEIYDDVALLRSLAVVEGKRNQGLGQLVYSALIEHAKSKNIKQIYLLTETAEKFFLKNGFIKVERNKIPETIKNTYEYKVLCAESAIVLMKNI
ncbi:MAG: GNAT family N-acetyltransferase [Chitinophagales bacterium]|jgi:amino-acid N-acetyltransferase|nr:GNAT family N-acetyltransferase [Chitinophagales bacterium]